MPALPLSSARARRERRGPGIAESSRCPQPAQANPPRRQQALAMRVAPRRQHPQRERRASETASTRLSLHSTTFVVSDNAALALATTPRLCKLTYCNTRLDDGRATYGLRTHALVHLRKRKHDATDPIKLSSSQPRQVSQPPGRLVGFSRPLPCSSRRPRASA